MLVLEILRSKRNIGTLEKCISLRLYFGTYPNYSEVQGA